MPNAQRIGLLASYPAALPAGSPSKAHKALPNRRSDTTRGPLSSSPSSAAVSDARPVTPYSAPNCDVHRFSWEPRRHDWRQ